MNGRKWSNEEYAELLNEHMSGVRKCDLARSRGLSPERIRQAISKARRIERMGRCEPIEVPVNPFDTLSVRARNSLRAVNLLTVEGVRAAVVSGEIDRVPGLGVGGKSEVRRLLELNL